MRSSNVFHALISLAALIEVAIAVRTVTQTVTVARCTITRVSISTSVSTTTKTVAGAVKTFAAVSQPRGGSGNQCFTDKPDSASNTDYALIGVGRGTVFNPALPAAHQGFDNIVNYIDGSFSLCEAISGCAGNAYQDLSPDDHYFSFQLVKSTAGNQPWVCTQIYDGLDAASVSQYWTVADPSAGDVWVYTYY